MSEMVWALGLMSGTSLDGIDAALIRTDGITVEEFGPSHFVPYPASQRDELRKMTLENTEKEKIVRLEHELTLAHAVEVKALLKQVNLQPQDVTVIGFHGQTIYHNPTEQISWQIGNGSLLAQKTSIDVICDFRRHDVAAGGQGAPLVPLYHAALAHDLEKPIAVVNIGGISNVTWIGKMDGETKSEDRSPKPLVARSALGSCASQQASAEQYKNILAFDTGPGNALLNDWVNHHTGNDCDRDGVHARKGKIHQNIVKKWLTHQFFNKKPPKSLDRGDFTLKPIEGLSIEDGAATLTAFTAESIAKAAEWFPEPVTRWLITGGGRKNPVIMENLRQTVKTNAPIDPVEDVSWDGDMLEAQAFAFLAVRSLKGLPLTLPTTTGANYAVTGGAFYRAGCDVSDQSPASA